MSLTGPSGCVGSEVARLRAGHRPPLKLDVQFSRIQLSRRHTRLRCDGGHLRSGPSTHPSGQSRSPVSSDDDVRVFPKGTDPPHRPYSADFPSLPSCLRPLPSPAHSRRRSLGHAAFAALQVPFSGPTTDRASLAISLSLIGPLTPMHREILPVLLRSRAVLPYRARKHLGAVGE